MQAASQSGMQHGDPAQRVQVAAGLGRFLIEAIISEAKQIGYQRMRLDTLPPKMNDAIKLYRSVGFNEIGTYYDNPVPGAIFMELSLKEPE